MDWGSGLSVCRQIEIEEARRDPSRFIEYCFTDENGRSLKQEWFHRDWQDRISKHNRILIEAPRYHGKTEQLLGRVIWELGQNPNLRIKIICNSDEEASKRVSAIGHHIQYNPRVQRVFPDLKPASGGWTQHKLFVRRPVIGMKDPTVEARGILSTGTGGRADMLIADDVVDARNALQQPKLRDVVKEAWFNVWLNQIHTDGRVVYIFTVWHLDDLSHALKQQSTKDLYKLIRYVIDDDLNPIWPEKWGKKQLATQLELIGTRAFGRAFQGRAISDEDAIFNQIENCIDHDLCIDDIPDEWPRYAGIDLAIGKKNENARSVVFTIALDPKSKKKYWLEIRAGRWSSPNTARQAIAAFRQYKHRVMNVENNAYQEAFTQWLKEIDDSGLRHHVKSFTTGKNKADEAIGLPGLAVEIENGAWVIPHGDCEYTLRCDCQFCKAIKEFKSYPVGEFTDRIMACWFANEAIRSGLRGPHLSVTIA